MNAAIILAGGRGTRFGTEIPKQYIEVFSKPVLAYTLEVFQNSPDIDSIAIVCQSEYCDFVRNICRKYCISKLSLIVPGGNNCPESIKNGINALRSMLSDTDNVLLHMSVSPLVSQEDISSALDICSKKGCCFTMHPINICMAQNIGADWAEKDVNPLETPYMCAQSPEELDALIRQTSPQAAMNNCRKVLEYYGTHETGHAAEAAAAYICSKLN